jgi:hypothetical protein
MDLNSRENWQPKGALIGSTKLPETFQSLFTNFLNKVDPICKLSPPSSFVTIVLILFTEYISSGQSVNLLHTFWNHSVASWIVYILLYISH